MQTVRDACLFDPKAIDYALSDQIESLEDLVGHDAARATAFFAKTYVTGGMRTLLRQGLQRLAGASGQAVFEMKQAMGGGKTHSMLALLAASTSTCRQIADEDRRLLPVPPELQARENEAWIFSRNENLRKKIELYTSAGRGCRERALFEDREVLPDLDGASTARDFRATASSGLLCRAVDQVGLAVLRLGRRHLERDRDEACALQGQRAVPPDARRRDLGALRLTR